MHLTYKYRQAVALQEWEIMLCSKDERMGGEKLVETTKRNNWLNSIHWMERDLDLTTTMCMTTTTFKTIERTMHATPSIFVPLFSLFYGLCTN